MKKLLLVSLVLSAFATPALAETRICEDESGAVKAEITETYIDILLIRKLHKIEVNSETVFRSWLGLTDNGGEGQRIDNNLSVRMYSGGMTLLTPNGEIKLECGPGY